MRLLHPIVGAAIKATDNFKYWEYGWCVLGIDPPYKRMGKYFKYNGKKYSVDLWNNNNITIERNGITLFSFPKPQT